MTIQQRIEERSAKKASEQIARNLLSKGLEPAFVAENTGLTLETIKKILVTVH